MKRLAKPRYAGRVPGAGLWLALLVPALLAPLRPAAAALSCAPQRLAAAVPQVGAAYRHGVLWRVQRGSVPPSYVFGTIHLGGKQISRLAPPVERAFDHASSLTLETILDRAGVLQFSRAMYYRKGGVLSAKVGSDLYAATLRRLAAYGIPEAAASLMKPWAAYLTLSLPPDAQGLPLDLQLMQRARKRGIPVYGLESIKEQAAALGDLPGADQISLLRDAVCNYDEVQKDIAHMKRLYLRRDLGALYTFANRYDVGERQLYRRVMNALLWQRNRRMVKRMAPRLSAGNAFIAIGALHLPGARGVLGLLKAEGYRVEPVY